jgi:hypothetical protein
MKAAPPALSVSDMPRDFAGPILVYFEGVEINGVVAYDADAGWVEAFKHGADGELLIDAAGIKTHRLFGKVTAVLKSE